ncbi:MAG: histidinol-phosphatase HisJ family protein [Clostridiales bacterium]|jgi:histidinol-phosphatase (PHP family)|nr:histidinol-phosphatase HisJ family protein [Clostridiales bacterium]
MACKSVMDLHVHTDNSFDGHHSTMYMCETAVSKGLRAVAFTDHCEVDAYYKDNFDRSVRQSYIENAKARSAFMGQLLVLQGIELAQPHYDVKLAESIVSGFQYDIVIGSVHNLRDRLDFYHMESFNPDEIDAMVSEYLDELINMAHWGGFDTLAHLTYPFRYFYARAGISVDINDYADKVDTILSLLVEKEKALEINTGGLRQPINKLSPEFETVKRFKQLGGEYITIGSDAHYAEHLASGFEEAKQAAMAAGFKNETLFQSRSPFLIPLE